MAGEIAAASSGMLHLHQHEGQSSLGQVDDVLALLSLLLSDKVENLAGQRIVVEADCRAVEAQLLHQAEHLHIGCGTRGLAGRLRRHLLLHLLHRLDEVERVAAEVELEAERAGVFDGDVVLRDVHPPVGQVPCARALARSR